MQISYAQKKSKRDILANTPVCRLNGSLISDNLLIKGDNLKVLQTLLKVYNYANKIDLIYIDPPYATNRVFSLTPDRARAVSCPKGAEAAYADTLRGEEFLEFIRERIILARELLSEVGSIYLHIDYKIGHYIKVIMDEIFGIENFRNDISRIKCNPKNFNQKSYGNIKDMILFYSKTREIIWNDPMVPYTPLDLKTLFKKTDRLGRPYTTVPLHAPGESGDSATGGLFRGLAPPPGRHWRTDPAELEKMDAHGLIEWSKSGNPRKIIYPDCQKGKKRQDIWEFKDCHLPCYPTEKNMDLLKTIIRASSNDCSFVLDFFCGSGTTLLAAGVLARRWIGIDRSPMAIEITQRKLDALESGQLNHPNYSYLEEK
ncbi:MAG: site-specific DNA-methyltransferase [Deltaproteobacteria bacterium]|jgi:adenine-specific DNA-methyltransferase|nr:site-specific DNA-methyltransferase [Deltaproteobacteria bacterium]